MAVSPAQRLKGKCALTARYSGKGSGLSPISLYWTCYFAKENSRSDIYDHPEVAGLFQPPFKFGYLFQVKLLQLYLPGLDLPAQLQGFRGFYLLGAKRFHLFFELPVKVV